MTSSRALCLALALLPAPALAHPHVFADTGYALIFDSHGRLAAIRTHWVYDELFTLLVIEDGKHDTDGDGEISAEELKGLADFDSQWPDGYDGDLHVSQGGAAVTAGPPQDWSVDWADGKLGSTHTRAFDPPLDMAKGAVRISPYDPGYYVAYHIAPAPVIEGRSDCRVDLGSPDLDAEAKRIEAEIAATPADVNLNDMGYLDVGVRFAEWAVVSCGN